MYMVLVKFRGQVRIIITEIKVIFHSIFHTSLEKFGSRDQDWSVRVYCHNAQWCLWTGRPYLEFCVYNESANFVERYTVHFDISLSDMVPVIIPPNNEVVGEYIGFTPSVRPSVRLSRLPCPLCNIYSSGWILSILATNDHYHERVCPTQWPFTLTYIFKVIRPWLRKIASTLNFWQFFRAWPWKIKSTVLNGFFPYLAQMITGMRGCVACNDLWPWPISSRSFGLGLENRVRSVASTVLDGFFPYLRQMITSMRRCVACDDLWPWPISSRSFDLDFENRVRSVMFSVLDWLFPYLPQIIITIRGCVTCQVYNKILKFKFFANFSNFLAFTFKKKIYNSACILSIFGTNHH